MQTSQQMLANTWKQWFHCRNNRVSFLDDNHLGGTIKHMQVSPATNNNAPVEVEVRGYNGIDELLTCASFRKNKDLTLEAFLTKYKKPFSAHAQINSFDFNRKLNEKIICTFQFYKDTHTEHNDNNNTSKPAEITTSWEYQDKKNAVKIIFNDIITRNVDGNPVKKRNEWESSDFIKYELESIFAPNRGPASKTGFCDRALL